MNRFIEALNRPVLAFERENKGLAWLLVALTIFAVAVFEPILQNAVLGSAGMDVSISAAEVLLHCLYGVLTYGAVCLVFWMVCMAFGGDTGLKRYINSWGLTYLPTLFAP